MGRSLFFHLRSYWKYSIFGGNDIQPHFPAYLRIPQETPFRCEWPQNEIIVKALEGSGGPAVSPGLGAYNDVVYALPVFINNNVYFMGAVPYGEEKVNVLRPDVDPGIKLVEQEGDLFLQIGMDGSINGLDNPPIHTGFLGTAVRTGQRYEHTDGSSLCIDKDYFGTPRNPEHPSAGPFEDPGTGQLRMKVWDSR